MKYDRSFTSPGRKCLMLPFPPNGILPNWHYVAISLYIADCRLQWQFKACNSAVIALLAPACVTQQEKEIPFPLLLLDAVTCHMLSTTCFIPHAHYTALVSTTNIQVSRIWSAISCRFYHIIWHNIYLLSELRRLIFCCNWDIWASCFCEREKRKKKNNLAYCVCWLPGVTRMGNTTIQLMVVFTTFALTDN